MTEKTNGYYCEIGNQTKQDFDSYGDVGPYAHASAYSNRTFLNLEPNISSREAFTKDSYYNFRPNERPPTRSKDIIKACMMAYDNVGIIKNVIDLMGDFGSQGITLVHTDKRTQNFFRKWWKLVDGDERSERFLNTFYRTGNVFIQRESGTINRAMKTQMSATAKQYKGIPLRYKFLNPLSVEVKNGVAGIFLDDLEYEVNVSEALSEALKNANVNNKMLTKQVGSKRIPLDKENLLIFHYKKDDWQLWANPMIYAILDDIRMFEKMKLGDMAAMDGAICNVRLWTLGSLEHKIAPQKAAMDKLRNVLASNVGQGTIDLVWGPELSFQETESKVYNYLGDDKYKTVLNSIYGGLGIPQTLTGSTGQSGGFTNNFISMKTLIDRLEYGRDMLRKFWEKEIAIVQKAMGFAKPAQLHFNYMILANETAEKNLLVQLADRNIISYETVRERLNEIDGIENSRIRKEEKLRENEKMPPKSDPFHKVPEPMEEGGRPFTSTDKIQRKRKEVKPKTTPTMTKSVMDADKRYKKISELLQKPILAQYGKKSLRELTDSEFNEFEELKFITLCNFPEDKNVNLDTLNTVFSNGLQKTLASGVFSDNRAKFIEFHSRKPDVEEERFIRLLSYISTLYDE